MRADLLFIATRGLGGKLLTVRKGTLLTFWRGEHILDERGNHRVVHPKPISSGNCQVIQHRQSEAFQLEAFPLLPYALLDGSPYIEGLLPPNISLIKMDDACV